MSNLLAAHEVSKSYGDFKALNSVSLEIPRGSIFGLLGPNGAGKLRLLELLIKLPIRIKEGFYLMESPYNHII